jgi:hypothetical protein
MTAGYSGTPLAKKLGIMTDARVVVLNEPEGFRSLLDPLPDGVVFRSALRAEADVVMLFVVERKEFERRIAAAEKAIFPAGAIWIAWPKKASKVPTDMTEDVVRAVALPRGLVDNKVCAIDEVWSGLRIVWRKENRG